MSDQWFTPQQIDRLPLILQAEQAIERAAAAKHLAAITAERDSLQEQLARRNAELELAILFIPPANLARFQARRALEEKP